MARGGERASESAPREQGRWQVAKWWPENTRKAGLPSRSSMCEFRNRNIVVMSSNQPKGGTVHRTGLIDPPRLSSVTGLIRAPFFAPRTWSSLSPVRAVSVQRPRRLGTYLLVIYLVLPVLMWMWIVRACEVCTLYIKTTQNKPILRSTGKRRPGSSRRGLGTATTFGISAWWHRRSKARNYLSGSLSLSRSRSRH